MTETAVQIDQNQASNHPLKGKSYFAIDRTLAMREDISDGLYRLLSILFGSYGDDGILIFKIHTLCRLMGGKKERAVRRIIKQGRDNRFYTTRQTGRGIEFFINDRQESACLIGKNLPISYKQQKRSFKKTTTTPAAKKSPPEKPPEPIPKDKFVVVSSLKPLLRPDLRIQFGKKACEDLVKLELSPGQIKFFIKEINSKPDKKSIGWMLNRIKKTDDLSIIPDLDKITAEKVEAEKKLKEQRLIEEINAAKTAKESEKNAISFDKMHEQKLKSRGQLEFYLECRAKEKERIEKTIQKPFSEIKPLFLEYTGELIDRYSNLTDTQLLKCNEFKNFCYRNYWECLN